jgi:hypothetical protein
MKQIPVLVFFILILFHCEAQLVNTLPAAAVVTDTLNNNRPGAMPKYQFKKLDYHVSVGMDFSTASGYGSAFTQYVIPTVNYHFSKKFMVSGGIAIANTNYFNARPLYSGDIFQPYNGNYTSLTVFASGTYFVNDRLTISGSFYKEFPVSGKTLSYSPYNPISGQGQGSQGMNMNIKYKLGEHVFIQAGFQINQGRNAYDVNPYAPYHAHGLGDLNFLGAPQTMYNIFNGQ